MSKLTSIMRSLRGRSTLCMNRTAASCSNRNSVRMLLLVSTRTANRSEPVPASHRLCPAKVLGSARQRQVEELHEVPVASSEMPLLSFY